MTLTKPPRFDISAAVVRQLGDELVSDEVTALVELVKNAYDADADFAHVRVHTTGTPAEFDSQYPKAKGFITIDDNGMGMTEDEIVGGWLVISLSKKRSMKRRKLTTPKGRTPLGDKGLGRLSTQKLGNNLEMLTRRDGEDNTQRVSFTWTAFTEDKSLGAVPVDIATSKKPRKKGTLLVISDLRNASVWKGDAVDKLAGDLSQIISPFPQARPFLVTLTVDDKPIDLVKISEQARKAAAGKFSITYEEKTLALTGRIKLAKLRGNQTDDELRFFEQRVVADNGRDLINYLKSLKSKFEFRESVDPNYFIEFSHTVALSDLGGSEKHIVGNKLEPADPGPFKSEIDEFVLRGESNAKLSGLSGQTTVSDLVKRHAGIKIFRDGFAVKPFGMNGEDWLKLGAGQTSGSSWYGLRPHNVVGFVAISEAKNSQLREKTDREGFVSDAYSNNFRQLMEHATGAIGDFYEWIRRSYVKYRNEALTADAPFDDSRAAIASAAEVAKTLTSYASRATNVRTRSTTLHSQLKELTGRISSEPLLSTSEERQLSDILKQAEAALGEANVLFEEIQRYADDGERLAKIVGALAPRMDVLQAQLDDFAQLAGVGLIAEALSHEVLNEADRLTRRSGKAIQVGSKSSPPNTDLITFAGDVAASGSALRRQANHLGPSLRHQREEQHKLSLSDFANEISGYFNERWSEKKLVCRVQVSRDADVLVNKGRLTQVVDNLLLNAEYWLLDKGPATANADAAVTIEIEGPVVRIYDNGPGVSPAVEQSLFEPFVTLKPKAVGRGLGLFIAHQILESVGCSITLLHARNALQHRYIFELDLKSIANG